MTKEELMAEMMGLGYDRGEKRRYKTKREHPLPKERKQRTWKPRKLAPPLSSAHFATSPAEKQCESIPVKQELQALGLEPLSDLPVLISKETLRSSGSKFGAEDVAGKVINKRMKRGNRIHIPWDMFVFQDIAEFMRCPVATVRKVAGLLNMAVRVPGTNGAYAPITRAQAKAIMHHIHLHRGRKSL